MNELNRKPGSAPFYIMNGVSLIYRISFFKEKVVKMFVFKKRKQKIGWLLCFSSFLLFWSIFISGCHSERSFSNDKEASAKNQFFYTVTDDTGLSLQFSEKPKRIVSYSISTDEILLALVEPQRIIALSRLVDDPGVSSIVKEAKQVPNRVKGNSLEGVLAFKPDLVIIPDFHPPEMLQSARELGLKVYIYKTPSDIKGVKRSIRQLAALTGEKEKGEALVAQMEEKISRVQKRLEAIPQVQRKRVMQLRSEGAFYAPDNSFGDVCRHAGVTDATLELHYPNAMEITQEKIVELNPDIIFVPAWDYDGEHEPVAERQKILNNPSYKGIKAVQEGNVYSISGALVLTVSQYIADAVEEVAKMSYPDIFRNN